MPSTIDDDSTVSFTVAMTATEAYAYAQFLKRVSFSHYHECAVSKDDAYNMLYAGQEIRAALREQLGMAPR